MRWERLFDDLEAQLAAEETRELAAEVADRTRRERALLGLQERFAAVLGGPLLQIRVGGVGILRGVVADAGPDWVLLDEHLEQTAGQSPSDARVDRPALVALHAVRAVTGLARAEQPSAVAKAFGMGSALRAVSRDRAVVDVVDVDGTVVTGTVDAVGRDLLEVAEHLPELPRRQENVLRRTVVPVAALAAVRRR